MPKVNYDALIIDGSVARYPNERCMRLLDHAHGLVLDQQLINWAFERWSKFHAEVTFNWQDDNHDWNELEDEIIEFINQMLPDGVVCMLIEDDPGTVTIWDTRGYDNEND